MSGPMVHAASDIAQQGARSEHASRPLPGSAAPDGPARLSFAVLVDIAGKPPELRHSGAKAIADAVPRGCHRCWDQHEWLTGVKADIEAQGWRRDRVDNAVRVCRELAGQMDWQQRTSLPGHAALAARAGCTTRTVTSIIGWLLASRWLGRVSPGRTDRLCKVTRPRPPDEIYKAVLRKTRSHERARRAAMPHLLAGTGNQRAVYVLTVPHRKARRPRHDFDQPLNFHLTQPKAGVGLPHRTREARPKPGKARAPRGLTPETLTGTARRLSDRPKNRAESMFAACQLQDHFPLLRRISAAHVRHIVWPLTRHGYTPADILHAIDHDRTGIQRMLGNPDHAAHVPRWLRWRLAHSIEWASDTDRAKWIRDGGDPAGTILPSHSQQLDQAAAHQQARQAAERAQRAERAHNRSAPIDQARFAATAREQLAAALAAPPAEKPAAATPAPKLRPEVDAYLSQHGGSGGAELLARRKAAGGQRPKTGQRTAVGEQQQARDRADISAATATPQRGRPVNLRGGP